MAGVLALDRLARSTSLPASYSAADDDGGISATGVAMLAIAGAVAVAIALSLVRSGTEGWGWTALQLLGSIVVFLLIASLFAVKTAASGGGGGATGSW